MDVFAVPDYRPDHSESRVLPPGMFRRVLLAFGGSGRSELRIRLTSHITNPLRSDRKTVTPAIPPMIMGSICVHLYKRLAPCVINHTILSFSRVKMHPLPSY